MVLGKSQQLLYPYEAALVFGIILFCSKAITIAVRLCFSMVALQFITIYKIKI